jgi:hypothetical protein
MINKNFFTFLFLGIFQLSGVVLVSQYPSCLAMDQGKETCKTDKTHWVFRRQNILFVFSLTQLT